MTGGAGYVGAVLVPKLLRNAYRVKVLDLYIYGDYVLNEARADRNLEQIRGDIRNRALLEKIVPGCDAVIHLACISNDPSFALNPELGRSINYDAFIDLVNVAKKSGVQRFVYASSSSVYGISDEPEVTETVALKPLTDYSKFKALCEDILLRQREPGFATLVLRPATVCGYSPRQRLDLTVNILTNQAVHNKKITVLGGKQMRPNIHIEDMADLYVRTLEYPTELIDGEVFNAGYQNRRVEDIAEVVRRTVNDGDIRITTVPTDDNRSYHISSERIRSALGFEAKRGIEDAVRDLVDAFHSGKLPDAMTDIRYYNIKTMQSLKLK